MLRLGKAQDTPSFARTSRTRRFTFFTHLEISGIVCFIRMANDKDIEAAVGKVRKGNGNILIDDLGMVFQGFRQVLQ